MTFDAEKFVRFFYMGLFSHGLVDQEFGRKRWTIAMAQAAYDQGRADAETEHLETLRQTSDAIKGITAEIKSIPERKEQP